MSWVTITMEVPLKEIDFTDCGDGCGQIDGLKYAKFKGVRIERFAAEDLIEAENAMRESLGEPVGRYEVGGRQAYLKRIAAEEHAAFVNDPINKARHG